MAVDTENKRRGAVGVAPTPDGTIDQQDRRQAVKVYPGDSTSSGASKGGKIYGDGMTIFTFKP